MTTDCTSDEFYQRMTLAGVEGQPLREVTKLPLSNCNTYQEFLNFDDFEQEVSIKGKTIDKTEKFKYQDIANTFSDIIQEKPIKDDNNFKLANEIILLVAREIQNSIYFISIMSNNNSVVLLDKQNGKDRFLGLQGKVEVSKILKDMLKDEIFSKTQDIQPEQMLSILMAFFTFNLLSRQYNIIFKSDFDNDYIYNAGFAEITPDLIGTTNFVYIQKNRAIISNLFGINPDTLGNSKYEIIIDPQGEIIIVRTMFYFLFGAFKDSKKILLAMIQNTITYYLSSNRKTIEDKFRWILCQSDYNFIKNQCGDSEQPWFMDCLSIDKDLKPVTKVEVTQNEIVLKNKRIAEMEELIASTASIIANNNSKLSPKEIQNQIQQNEQNKINLQRMKNDLERTEAQLTVNIETQNKIEGINSDVAEMEARITKNESDIETNSSNLSPEQIEEKRQENEDNKTRLTELRTQISQLTQPEEEFYPKPTVIIEAQNDPSLVASDPSLAATTEENAKIGIGSRVLSKMKEYPGRTLLGLGGVAAGVLTGLAFTTGLGGKHTKKPRRKLKKRATQRKPKILTKNNTKKRKKNKKRRVRRTIKNK